MTTASTSSSSAARSAITSASLFEGMRLERARGGTTSSPARSATRRTCTACIERIQELGHRTGLRQPTHRREPRGTRSQRTPDTIVLVHGFWVTPAQLGALDRPLRGARASRVLAPAYPGFEVEVEALNADPTPIEDVTVPEIIEHLEAVVGALDTPPILIGHSAGGAFTQILLDHGFGAAGVAINSAPTEGVTRRAAVAGQVDVPGAQEPGQPPPGRRLHARAVALRVHQHASAEEESRALYERYHIPASGRIFWGSVAGQHPARPPGHLGRLPQRRPRAAAVHLRQRGPHHAAGDPAVQRQALQVETRSPRSRSSRARTCCPPQAGLGGDRRLRARLGRSRTPRRRAAA